MLGLHLPENSCRCCSSRAVTSSYTSLACSGEIGSGLKVLNSVGRRGEVRGGEGSDPDYAQGNDN